MSERMEEFEGDVEGVDFLAHVNDTLERLLPGHGDLVQVPGEPGLWNPAATSVDREVIMTQLRSLSDHNRRHGETLTYMIDCEWCEQARAGNFCLFPGCQKGFEHRGGHAMRPGWENV